MTIGERGRRRTSGGRRLAVFVSNCKGWVLLNVSIALGDSPVSLGRYLLFMTCMGGLSVAVGWLGDHLHMPGIVTVLVFSLVSLVRVLLRAQWATPVGQTVPQ